ncbi:HAD-IA family hydrolase [Jannaschia donghaensis]|uniref:Phosphoglycolate phosphatase n=1 Tax=Jannaschia donghaensis TaxID=420998 RepID=A0A0M6YJM7_9RHOB|nr:HAD-IA family hydrolase [Jannaschia donghaensis]CTQ50124.1 Phosphoglycolate phosphatase [Jannaschia donghaensis]
MADLLVLFDVDGTLVDADAQIAETLRDACLAAGHEAPDASAVKATIGLSLPEMVAALMPMVDADGRDRIISGYRLRFADSLERLSEPPMFDGAESTLRRLGRDGIALGLATGRSRLGVDHLLNAMEWRDVFATVQCAQDNPSKPDPTMLHRAMQATGHPPERTVFVGDTTFDMEMGSAAGVTTLGVAWGYHPVDALRGAGAGLIVPDFAAMITEIERMPR